MRRVYGTYEYAATKWRSKLNHVHHVRLIYIANGFQSIDSARDVLHYDIGSCYILSQQIIALYCKQFYLKKSD